MNLYNKVINNLISKNVSLSVAESCTGGKLSSKITSVPGASKVFLLGIVSYSNKSKTKILKIPSKIIKKYGAVSDKIAKLMVQNLFIISKCQICISITGIAGPTGSTKNKPVGLVFIGIKYNNKTIVIKKKYKGTRSQIQNKTVKDIFIKINSLI